MATKRDRRPQASAWLSRPNAARYLGISTDTLDKRVEEGTLTPFQMRNSTRSYFRVSDLDEAMQPVESPAPSGGGA